MNQTHSRMTMSNKEYKVGQIVYVVYHKQTNVWPMQIVEEITKKSLNGVVKTYVVRDVVTGGDPKMHDLSKINGEVFESAEELQQCLIDRVTNAIVAKVNSAVTKAKTLYTDGFESQSLQSVQGDDNLSTVAPAEDELPHEPMGNSIIELPDGTKVKVRSFKLPKELQG